jgi:hypothetical protein
MKGLEITGNCEVGKSSALSEANLTGFTPCNPMGWFLEMIGFGLVDAGKRQIITIYSELSKFHYFF